MKSHLTSRRGGFTLVEIMIVVAIIALLASIAVPSFLRARKRSQGTTTLETLRTVDSAKDQYAIENWQRPDGHPGWLTDLYPYVKSGTKLYTQLVGNTTPVDALQNTDHHERDRHASAGACRDQVGPLRRARRRECRRASGAPINNPSGRD